MPKNIYNKNFRLELYQYYNIENYNKDNFTSQNNTPFTYLIGWSKTNMFYYCVKWLKGCLPSDIMNTYFTSSKIVQDYIKENDYPDIIIVDKIFDNNENAREYEHQFLKFHNAKYNPNFLNKTNGNKDLFTGIIKPFSQETIQKLRDISLNRQKILCIHCNREFDIGNYTLYHGDKCSVLTGKKHTNNFTINKHPKILCEYCNKEFDKNIYTRFHGNKCKVFTGVSPVSEETKNKIRQNTTPITQKERLKRSERVKNEPKISCEHCGKTLHKNNYIQFHGDKCSVLTGVSAVSKETRNKISKKRILKLDEFKYRMKNLPLIICEHCNKEFTKDKYNKNDNI